MGNERRRKHTGDARTVVELHILLYEHVNSRSRIILFTLTYFVSTLPVSSLQSRLS